MNKLVAYAMQFSSFLLLNLEKQELIKSIILFGSVARGEATKDSDVDIFVDVLYENKKLEKDIQKIANTFYNSIFYKKYWKLLGIENDIKCIVGKLDEWKSLQPSIMSDGILLFGKYRGMIIGKPQVLLYWKKIKTESKRVAISKKIYGYNYKGKRYEGIIEKLGGKKISNNCILVDLENAANFAKLFRDEKIPLSMIYLKVAET